MKKYYLLVLSVLLVSLQGYGQISITAARAQGAGSTVTVKGLVTSGADDYNSDLRYFQDGLAGLAAFSSKVQGLVRGDSIEITGTLKDYNGLLEMDPVSSVTVINQGNTLPTPPVLSFAAGFVESFEGMLVQFINVSIPGASGTFSANSNYTISDGSNSEELSLFGKQSSNSLIGTSIPTGNFSVVGIMGEYNGTYQIQPRDLNDLGSGPKILTALMQDEIKTSSFRIKFETKENGNTIINYGETPFFEIGNKIDGKMTKDHKITLTSLDPATLYYIQAISIGSSNDSSIAEAVMMTASNSSGAINVYFNNPVDHSVTWETPTNYCNHSIADTVIKYINSAVNTLDVCAYNIDNKNGVIDAINAAHNRGVDVRFVTDDGVNATNYGLLNIGAGNKVKGPTGQNPQGQFYGIMHNKLFIIDADDVDDAIVISGSTNWTDQQMVSDFNNIISVQDQSLAQAYTIEFEEMFNGTFGPDKVDNTPHFFNIGGSDVQLYFSPSDNMESKLISTIEETDEEMFFAVFTYTRFSVSYAIEDMIQATGARVGGIVETIDTAETEYTVLKSAMGNMFKEHDQTYDLHHKYMIVDPNNHYNDPTVFTGSYNWTSSGNSRNDENTLVIHDQDIANQFYQEFRQRFLDLGATSNDMPYEPVNDTTVIDTTDTTDTTIFVRVLRPDEINVFPNPTNGVVQVLLPNGKGSSMVRISSINGQSIIEQEIAENERLLYYDLNGLNAGIYFIEVRTSKESYREKLILVN